MHEIKCVAVIFYVCEGLLGRSKPLPYNIIINLYCFGIRQPSPLGEGGGEADG